MKPFILASGSPRRKELLEQAKISFTAQTSDVDETIDPALSPEDLVQSLALQKAAAVFEVNKDAVVLGADTIVVLAGQVLGKPNDREHARGMLRALSGKKHSVLTGVSILSDRLKKTFFVETRVQFWELTNEEIERYLDTNEPFDKAGAYGIQGFGATLVAHIEGDYFSVVGLPLSMTVRELNHFGITPNL
ncbi:nucleoside triphosphate pyrophosphatase [Alkalihalobacillus sp. BA299]|uniref:Maf family protein n=1 Tax=Alkalihalobacillus sp. BA299 TaxID=2815938 RepID=UPI001ADC2A27|nr:Maf family protein [Alkalihalobacillus sp. BA299]